jgi:streptomycin 3"-adenylyltransferase
MTSGGRLDELGLARRDLRQMDEIVRTLRDVLAADLHGVYLSGSAVLGGLRAQSDTDLLAVSLRPATTKQKDQLVGRLLHISGQDRADLPGRTVELTVVVASQVRPWIYPPRRDFQCGEWWRERFEAGDRRLWRPTADPDLAILVTMARRDGIALVGPPASEVFDPVPEGDFTDALVAGVPGLIDDLHWDTRNVVLTLARIWCGLVTLDVLGKDVAANWALSRLPPEHRPVLAQARNAYLRGDDERWDAQHDEVDAFADEVVAQIRALRPGNTDVSL